MRGFLRARGQTGRRRALCCQLPGTAALVPRLRRPRAGGLAPGSSERTRPGQGRSSSCARFPAPGPGGGAPGFRGAAARPAASFRLGPWPRAGGAGGSAALSPGHGFPRRAEPPGLRAATAARAQVRPRGSPPGAEVAAPVTAARQKEWSERHARGGNSGQRGAGVAEGWAAA